MMSNTEKENVYIMVRLKKKKKKINIKKYKKIFIFNIYF